MTNAATNESTPPPPPKWDANASDPRQAQYAGFWIRFGAYMIDGLVITAAAAVLVAAMTLALWLLGYGDNWDDESDFVTGAAVFTMVALIVVSWLYEAVMTSGRRGATLGKIALGLRVVRSDGSRLSFGRATGRHFAKVLVTPLVPFGIGYMMAGFTERKRALHDTIAATLVIR